MSVKQRTLKSEFSLNGKGLHTGKQVTATFKPAEENFGYRIRRMDLEGSPEIPALAEYVKLMDRASCLEKDGVCVFTMEHAMAALYGCGIDNCLIELSGEEFPILDGSAKYYVKEIEKVGFEEQKADRRYFTVKEQMEFCSEDGQTKITLLPDTDYNINLVVAYDSPYLQMQYATYSEKVTDFAKEIAPCRTFVFLRELEMLLQHNLIKGGDLDNAIVIVDREISQEEVNRLAKLFNHDSIEVKQGILNNLDLSLTMNRLVINCWMLSGICLYAGVLSRDVLSRRDRVIKQTLAWPRKCVRPSRRRKEKMFVPTWTRRPNR